MRRRTSFTDRNGNTTSYSYCVCGGLDSVTDPQTNTMVYARDLADRITSVTYNNQFWQNFARDALGRIVIVTNQVQQSFNYTYDNVNRLLQVASPQGAVFAAAYDDSGGNLPLVVQNAEGILTTNFWDIYAHLIERDYANGMVHHWSYANGLLTSQDDGSHTTTYGYDPAGQLASIQDADNNFNYSTYGPDGQLLALTNGNGAVTLWGYDSYGRMIAKTNANGTLVETNGYDADGRLTRHWTPAMGLTQYSYDNNGNPSGATYSSGPGVSASYDSLNRLTSMTDAVGTSSFGYQNFGPFRSALASETGPWSSDTLSRVYTAYGLPTSYSLSQPSGSWSGGYTYDAMLRLHTLSSPAGTFAYTYANATGRQIASLALPGSTISYGYDPAGLLTSTALGSGGQTLDSYAYTYNSAGWRTGVGRADGSQVNYGYDNIGQLTSATGLEPNSTPRYNENFAYAYDPAGNLTNRMNDTLQQAFTVDGANELTNVQRTTVVMTLAGAITNSVTGLAIDGQSAAIYGDKTFAAQNVPLVNGANTFTNVLTQGGLSLTNQTTMTLPISANLSYDLNGNLISDGQYGYQYDSANELTTIILTNRLKSQFVYDGFGRRRIRREYVWQGGWVQASETHYVYDGMAVIQERDGNNSVKVSYTRGLDLSGSFDGAGGIGGLLARTDANGSAYYHADGNGNITAMANSSGGLVAKYLYDPYGNLLNKSGSLADVNLYRFSSKEISPNSGLYYYGFRFYQPNLQRWINQDPIREFGGLNLYSFVRNSPIRFSDKLGLELELDPESDPEADPDITPPGFNGLSTDVTSEEQQEILEREEITQYEKYQAEQQAAQESAQKAAEEIKTPDSAGSEGDNAPPRTVRGPKQEPCGGAYKLVDPETDQTMRTGRTKNLARRQAEHGRDPILGKYRFVPVYRTDDYNEQRGLEFKLDEMYNPPLNYIRPISSSNPNRDLYIDAADDYMNRELE
jgi:RHS repeat-associated protein